MLIAVGTHQWLSGDQPMAPSCGWVSIATPRHLEDVLWMMTFSTDHYQINQLCHSSIKPCCARVHYGEVPYGFCQKALDACLRYTPNYEEIWNH
jgi:hypothetical protein